MLPARLPLAIDTRRVESFDGTQIAYHVTGASRPAAKVVILANGLGGTYLAFRGQIDYLADRYRFVTWDYRGLYGSKRPPSGGPGGYEIPSHVRDLEAIVRAERIDRASIVGWSMGVQVALEAQRRMPDLAANLVLLNGSAGRPLDALTPVAGMRAMLPSMIDLARHAHALATQVARRATGQPEVAAWFKRLGLVAPTFDDAVFAELVHALAEIDMEAFLYNLAAIGRHDASEVLASIRVPALVVTGDRDFFTPKALAQQMARRIPAAELLVVRGGTHYTAVEFPELVNLRIERFYRQHGF